MITLIIFACQLGVSDPTENNSKCKIFKEPIFDESVTPMACMMQSQIRIVKFQEEHPGWKVHKWSCKTSLTTNEKA